jgi:hypothetical protein
VLCKIDVQGAEKDVLEGFGRLMEQVDLFIVEVSLLEFYPGQALFDDIILLLCREGFTLAKLYGAFTDPSGSLLQCDALFRRRAAPQLPSLPDEMRRENGAAGPFPETLIAATAPQPDRVEGPAYE